MLNTKLQAIKARTVNVHSLSRNIAPADIAAEVQNVVSDLEAMIRGI